MPKSKYWCDWCDGGNEEPAVEILIVDEEKKLYICDKCVALCNERIREERRERADNLQDIRENGT